MTSPSALNSLRAALLREARRIVPDIPPLSTFLESFLPSASLRRAALAYALGNALGTPARLLRPPALAVELLHAATLLHDDLLDADPVRRSLPAAWHSYGPHPAVLLGDALLCRALTLLSSSPRSDLLPALSHSASLVCRAELLQDFPSPYESGPCPLRRARRRNPAALKTSPLFSFAARSSAPPDSPPALLRALSLAGTRLGTAFQLLDDARDARPPLPPPPISLPRLLTPLRPYPALHSAALSWAHSFLL